MKKIFKYLMPAIPIFSYLLIPSNSSISNSFFPSYSKDPQTQHIIDSLNSANRQSQLERIAQFEEQKKLVEKIKKFNAEKDPIYLTEKELDTYINKLYKKGIAPKEISKQLFKEIIKKESVGNIHAFSNNCPNPLAFVSL